MWISSVAAEETNIVPMTQDIHPALHQLERCRPWLEPALEGGFFSWSDVQSLMLSGSLLLWEGRKSAILTEDVTYPQHKAVQVWLAGGDMDEIIAMTPGLEAAARMRGCDRVLIEGREGWQKALSALDYKPFSFTVVKEL